MKSVIATLYLVAAVASLVAGLSFVLSVSTGEPLWDRLTLIATAEGQRFDALTHPGTTSQGVARIYMAHLYEIAWLTVAVTLLGWAALAEHLWRILLTLPSRLASAE